MTDFQYFRSKLYKTIFSATLTLTFTSLTHSMELITSFVKGAQFLFTSFQAAEEDYNTFKYYVNELELTRMQDLCEERITHYQRSIEEATAQKNLWEECLAKWTYNLEIGTLHIESAQNFITFCEREIDEKKKAIKALKSEKGHYTGTESFEDHQTKLTKEIEKRDWQIKNIHRLLKTRHPYIRTGNLGNRLIKSVASKIYRLGEEGNFLQQPPDFELYLTSDPDPMYEKTFKTILDNDILPARNIEKDVDDKKETLNIQQEQASSEDNTETSHQTTATPPTSPAASNPNTSQDAEQVPLPSTEADADSKAQPKEQPTTQAPVTTNAQPSGQPKTNKKGKK